MILLVLPALLITAHASACPADRPVSFAGHWNGAMTREGKTWSVNLDIASPDTEPVGLVDLVDYGIYALPFSISGESNKLRLERKQPTGPSVLFDGTVEGQTYSGSFSGLGVAADFVLTKTDAPPSVLQEKEVLFRNGAVTLAGTVLIPPGNGPHPAIVCTHGAGPEGRERGSYHSNGYFFARLGFVTLIYDKRGVGKSTGDFQSASLDDLADDALAGVRALRKRKDVVARRIGMSGVSQGGWVSPLAATRSRDVAFILVISPSGINPMDQSVFDTENRMRKAGVSPEAIATASALRKRMYAMPRVGKIDGTLRDDIEKVHNEPWFKLSELPYPMPTSESDGARRFLLFEPVPTWEKVRVPVLALWGEDDQSVPAAKSRELLDRALVRARNGDVTLKIFPRADHGLNMIPSATDAWDFPRAAAGSRDVMSAWLLGHVDHGPRLASLRQKLVEPFLIDRVGEMPVRVARDDRVGRLGESLENLLGLLPLGSRPEARE